MGAVFRRLWKPSEKPQPLLRPRRPTRIPAWLIWPRHLERLTTLVNVSWMSSSSSVTTTWDVGRCRQATASTMDESLLASAWLAGMGSEGTNLTRAAPKHFLLLPLGKETRHLRYHLLYCRGGVLAVSPKPEVNSMSGYRQR